MKTSGHCVLITGGATGIGLALAESFLKERNEVIICGRRMSKLQEAKKKNPALHVRVCDLSKGADRAALFKWVSSSFPKLNVLVNNAGIQRELDFTEAEVDVAPGLEEIKINLEAPIALAALFAPFLSRNGRAVIVNVSSGLAFVPLAAMPVYCATKAALHSFSISLRHQLRGKKIGVMEVVPPMVDTDLDGGADGEEGQEDRGIKPAQVASEVLEGLRRDEIEVVIGIARNLVKKSRTDPEGTFRFLNR